MYVLTPFSDWIYKADPYAPKNDNNIIAFPGYPPVKAYNIRLEHLTAFLQLTISLRAVCYYQLQGPFARQLPS